jgi:hypothetical protein
VQRAAEERLREVLVVVAATREGGPSSVSTSAALPVPTWRLTRNSTSGSNGVVLVLLDLDLFLIVFGLAPAAVEVAGFADGFGRSTR